MQFRRLGLVLVTLLIVMASLAGCVAVSDTNWPDRDLVVDLDTALAAQDMGMAGLMMGSVDWSEAEFSSFLTYLMRQNVGATLPVDEVRTWFEADNQIFIEVIPAAGAPLAGPIRLSGAVEVVNNRIQVDLSNAAVGNVGVMGAFLDVVEGAINRALDDPSLGVAVNVSTDEGMISVGLGG
jgi:hypothetical protein